MEEFDLLDARVGPLMLQAPGHLVRTHILARGYRKLFSTNVEIKSHALDPVLAGQ